MPWGSRSECVRRTSAKLWVVRGNSGDSLRKPALSWIECCQEEEVILCLDTLMVPGRKAAWDQAEAVTGNEAAFAQFSHEDRCLVIFVFGR